MRSQDLLFVPRPGAGTVEILLDRVHHWIAHPHYQLGVPITLTNDVSPRLYIATRNRGVRVSTWQSMGISRYAGLSNAAYLTICSLLGLSEWRCLTQNRLLIEEDFLHSSPSLCLFSRRPSKPEYACLFERPHVCSACVDFYCCLGAETEMLALNRFLKTLAVLD